MTIVAISMELEDAKAEIDRLRAELVDLSERAAVMDAMIAERDTEIDRLRNENVELRRALLEYGQHQHSCRRHTYPLLEPKICDCGWAEFFIKYTKTAKGGE